MAGVDPYHAHAGWQERVREALSLVLGARLPVVLARRDVVVDDGPGRGLVQAQLGHTEPGRERGERRHGCRHRLGVR